MKAYLPTDFSECSVRACEFAINNLPESFETILVHAVDTPQAGATLLINLDEELKRVAEENMNELIENLLQKFPNKTFGKLIMFGSLNQVMDRVSSPQDLIVVGTTGASGIEKLIGSNTSSLLRYAKCPLICVPNQADTKRINSALFATDFKNDSFQDRLDKMIDVVQTLSVKVDVLHVGNADETLNESLDSDLPELSVLQKSDVPYDMHFATRKGNDLEDVILSTANKIGSDAIITIPHHDGFIAGLFHRSISKKLSLHSEIPIIVIK